MEQTYKHGVRGQLGGTIISAPETSGTAAVYVGTAPVGQVKDGESAINTPVALYSYSDAVAKIGYSEDWDNYTLCEAVSAHFLNEIQPVGPIWVINVLDPATMRGAEETATINIEKGKGFIAGDSIIINSITIEDASVQLVQGEDYSLDYSVSPAGVIVTDLKGTMGQSVTAKYYGTTPDAVTAADIIGEKSEGTRTGLQAVGRVYNLYDVVPSLILAPKWSKVSAVHAAMIAASQSVAGKFFADVLSDLPDANGSITVDSIAKAIEAKETVGYNSESEKTAWPMAAKGEKKYHISTLTAVVLQQIDVEAEGVPYMSASNRIIDADGYAIPEKTTPSIYDEEELNELNANGITTIIQRGGEMRLWGPHTAAYKFSADGTKTDLRAVSDSTMRMLHFIINGFVLRNGDAIDKPLSRNEIDTIMVSEQAILDGYQAAGQLVGAPRITYIPSENTAEDIINGEFTFTGVVTPAPIMRAITATIAYTDEGIRLLAEELAEE